MAPVAGSPLEQVEAYIKENKVMVFSKSTCPFCVRIKQLFESLGIQYTALELDQIGKFTFEERGGREMTHIKESMSILLYNFALCFQGESTIGLPSIFHQTVT